MTTHDDNVREAQAQLASRVDDMRAMLALARGDYNSDGARDLLDDHGYDVSDIDAQDAAQDIVSTYGLSWERDSASFRDETVTYVHVLGTGGPHEEFQVTFASDGRYGYSVESVVFVSLPWYDKVEIPLLDDSHGSEDAVTVSDFYDTFYADLVHDDNVRLFS